MLCLGRIMCMDEEAIMKILGWSIILIFIILGFYKHTQDIKDLQQQICFLRSFAEDDGHFIIDKNCL